MAKQFTLGKKERLKSRKAIEQLFKEGQRFTVFPFRVLYIINKAVVANSSSPVAKPIFPVQAGVSVATKNFKKAVHRNRIKRMIKEAYRLQKKPLEEKLKNSNTGLFIFLIYTDKEMPAYQLLYDKVHVILTKLQKLINENPTSHS